MFKKYKFNDKEKQFLDYILSLEDLNKDDGYIKEEVIRIVNSHDEMDENEIEQIRNYVMQKNLEYGYKNDEPNEFGYATEELIDKLFEILEGKYYDCYF